MTEIECHPSLVRRGTRFLVAANYGQRSREYRRYWKRFEIHVLRHSRCVYGFLPDGLGRFVIYE